MNFTFEKNRKKIDSPQKWQELGHPMSKNHWKDGRSAMELAKFAIENTTEFKVLIKDVLRECGLPEQNFTCEPEAKTSLGKGMKQGGPRHHDLLMKGSLGCVISIEAKVTEPFDEPLEKKMVEQSKKKNGNQKDTRAYSLLEYFVEPKYYEKAMGIGYQLFAATRGTICSASTTAIMLVIVFTDGESNDPKYKNNDKDFNSFVKIIGADKNGKIVKKEGKNEIECWIKIKKVHIKK